MRLWRSRWGTLLRIVLGLGSLALLFTLFDPRTTLRTIAGADPAVLLATLLMFFAVILLRTLRWRLILHDLGIDTGFWRTVRIFLIGAWFNTFVPGNLGGDTYKVLDVARKSSKTLRPLAAVIVERLTGTLALLAIGIVAAFTSRGLLPTPAWLPYSLIAITLAFVLLIYALRFADPLAALLLRAVPPLRRFLPPERLAALTSFARELPANRLLFLRALLLGLAVQILVLANYWMVGRSLEALIPLTFFFVFFPLIELVSLMPITLNGLGVREALLVVFLRYAEVDASFALSLGILARIIQLGPALVGGLLLLIPARAPHQANH